MTMTKAGGFTELECWKDARELVVLVYNCSEKLIKNRDYSLADQLRRASVSVMNNIAEGYERFSAKDKLRLLNISVSSGREVESMTYILEDLGLLNEEDLVQLRDKIRITRARTLALCKYFYTKLP